MKRIYIIYSTMEWGFGISFHTKGYYLDCFTHVTMSKPRRISITFGPYTVFLELGNHKVYRGTL